MGFERGNQFGSLSRRTGTPNKATQEIREKIDYIVQEHISTISDDLSKLDPKDRVNFILQFLSFVVPKMKTIEVNDTSTNSRFTPIIIQDNDSNK
jgi:hypothetical protein